MEETLVFKMLGDDNRLRIMVLLLERQLCVGHIQNGLCLEQANTSKHLKALTKANMIDVVKQKQRKYYFISTSFLEEYKEIVVYLKELSHKQQYQEDANHTIHFHECGCVDGCLCKV